MLYVIRLVYSRITENLSILSAITFKMCNPVTQSKLAKERKLLQITKS
jgi:hypothetical protein